MSIFLGSSFLYEKIHLTLSFCGTAPSTFSKDRSSSQAYLLKNGTKWENTIDAVLLSYQHWSFVMMLDGICNDIDVWFIKSLQYVRYSVTLYMLYYLTCTMTMLFIFYMWVKWSSKRWSSLFKIMWFMREKSDQSNANVQTTGLHIKKKETKWDLLPRIWEIKTNYKTDISHNRLGVQQISSKG